MKEKEEKALTEYIARLDKHYGRLMQATDFTQHLIAILKSDRWHINNEGREREELSGGILETLLILETGYNSEITKLHANLGKIESLLQENLKKHPSP